ncbi:MAG: peptidylprolyl isomerase [Deltaproteobacteria bacterium]|nr:peptidylprolyl isomerase [Deltaproteobacteria bacterium]
MKKKISAALLFNFLITINFMPSAVSAEPEKVAVVNGTVIDKNEYERELARYKDQMAMQGAKIDDSNMPAVKNEVIENIIGMQLMYQASKEKGINIEQATIDEEWGQLKSQYPDEEKFKAALTELNITEEIIRDQINRGLTIQKFIKQNFVEKTVIPDSEVKAFYDTNPDKFSKPESVRASHILIRVEPEAEEALKKAAREKIEMAQKRIKAGEDFAAVAKEASQCPSSEKGGDLGFFTRGQMVKPFEDKAFSLEPGVVSDVVETRLGYHLIKVTEKQKAGLFSLDEVKEDLKQYLTELKIQKDISDYVKELREKAKVEIF